MIGDKALVIKTGEILEVDQCYVTMTFDIELPDDFPEEAKKSLGEWSHQLDIPKDRLSKEFKDSNLSEDVSTYVLSDDKRYNQDELIVGIENIREYKLKNLLK
jgi:hypothetical protein